MSLFQSAAVNASFFQRVTIMNDVKKRAALNFKFVADNPQKMMRQGRRSTLEKFADSVKEVKEEVAPLLVCAVASCFLVYFLVAP